MQSLEIISVNLWQILISLCNLLLLFLILKKCLYKPVVNALAKREETLREQYERAENAVQGAQELKLQWEEKMSGAQSEADRILLHAAESAENRRNVILLQTQDEAERIIRNAENEAELEKKKAEDDIRRQIVEVSALLTEKILGREINTDDHHELIGQFISQIGEDV